MTDSKLGTKALPPLQSAAPERNKPGPPKGTRPGGREKGTKNKVSGKVKEQIVAVFYKMGGVPEMAKWAKKNQTEFYKLYARLAPMEVSGPNGTAIVFETKERNDMRSAILEVAAAARIKEGIEDAPSSVH